ncbi:MAG: hypothetical protein GX455_13260 [Phycisphaerae bacterium]|nr:hypothetical protein [Phycisphaerae bacterium]
MVLVDNEWSQNAGSAARIRIKGNQHLVAIDFDWSSLKGKVVAGAELVCFRGEQSIAGLTISTIQAPWDENKSNALSSGLNPDGWAWPGSRFPSVAGGNSFSMMCQSPSRLEGDLYHWNVDAALIQANILGMAHGLCLHEWSADYSRNPTIFSREQSGKQPYLLLTLAEKTDTPLPQPPTKLSVAEPMDLDDLRLSMTAPNSGFAYEVLVNDKPLPRWNIPFVQPGQTQMIALRDIPLADDSDVNIAIRTIDRLDRKSNPANLTLHIPKTVNFPIADPSPLAAQPCRYPDLCAIPAVDKYDATGKSVGNLPDDYRNRNEIFDGRTIRLTAARGEVVSALLLIKGKGSVTIKCDLPLHADFSQALYVQSGDRMIPDPLVPFQTLALSPDCDTPVCLDVFVPFELTSEHITGSITLSDGRTLPIELTILPFAIPRRASFLCEMNSYGLPDRVETFYKLQRVAYDHRCHVNILYYSHNTAAPGSRKTNLDMLLADGRRMNQAKFNDITPGAEHGFWEDFIEAFGPYLSGQCFAKGHRGPIPAPGFYLPFHESWPLHVRPFFNGNPDAYLAFAEHPEYARTFGNILADFIAVAHKQRWDQTGFQLYLNNKGSLHDSRKAPWILDEPTDYWDYRALAYFGDLTRKAKGAVCPIKLDYRIDISRPEFDRGQLDRKADLWVASSDAMRHYGRLVTDRSRATGETIWAYGTSNDPATSNRQTLGWVLWAWRNGATGIVPWQTINADGSALKQADPLGIFIYDKQADGSIAVQHSLRLKAYLRAQQDIEYLNLALAKPGISRPQINRLFDQCLRLDARVNKSFAEDAGTATFDNLTPDSLRRLRESLIQLLM